MGEPQPLSTLRDSTAYIGITLLYFKGKGLSVYILKLFGNNVLRKMFGFKKE
jgi:hypothetical protein